MNLTEKNRINLDGKWIFAMEKHDIVCNDEFSIKCRRDLLESGLEIIPATVPGNFELDLYEAGKIQDPYFADNVLKMQEYEDRHLWFSREFESSFDESSAFLVFEGIDTFADIFLNGRKIAHTDNMLIAHEIKAEGLIKGMNDLTVHIYPTSIEARNFDVSCNEFAMKYNWGSLHVRKAPHMYGWDIMPRILSGGLWRSVYLVSKPEERIDEVYVNTVDIADDHSSATISIFYKITVKSGSLNEYSIKVYGRHKNSVFEKSQKLYHTSDKFRIWVPNAALWWTADLGDPALYDTTVELYKNESLIDSYKLNVGIRIVGLEKTSTTDIQGNGEFCFYLNNSRLFIRGTNWVPLDAFHSRDKDRLQTALDLVKDVGCNAIRCWGGNVYEPAEFFDYCDRNGIAVWQDFAMACAIYPQTEEFSDKLHMEAKSVVRLFRNHPSLFLWSGDNECDYGYVYWGGIAKDPNKNKLTRKTIPDVISTEDPERLYLPSSPYIDEVAYSKGPSLISNIIPENHLWGPRDYYKSNYYTTSMAHFASEMGYHGCPDINSMKKFLSEDKIWPWQNNDEWVVHAASPEKSLDSLYAYRIELMAKQVYEMWGFNPDSAEVFSIASQISQAEAMKFFVENFRSMKWRRTGIIWWNILDGWPQFSDAVVDYYFTKKLAYYYIKRSQNPVCLMFKEPDNWHIQLTGVNDTNEPVQLDYEVYEILPDRSVLTKRTTNIPANGIIQLDRIPFSMSDKHFYIIEWETKSAKGYNHYLAGCPPFNFEWYNSCLQKMESLCISKNFI